LLAAVLGAVKQHTLQMQLFQQHVGNASDLHGGGARAVAAEVAVDKCGASAQGNIQTAILSP